jgi:hypothetical protein
MTALISRATLVGGHDGRAEIEVETHLRQRRHGHHLARRGSVPASLDDAGVASIDELVGREWSVVLPALERMNEQREPQQQPQGEGHARSRHP